MFCTKCGKEIADGSQFCPMCGGKIGESVNNTSQNVYNASNENGDYSDKSRIAAGLLQIFLGGLGIGRFYTGHTGVAVAQLLVTFFTCGFGAIWGLIDGILILCDKNFKDSNGKIMKD